MDKKKAVGMSMTALALMAMFSAPASAASRGELVTPNGVRGDLLLGMLQQKPCSSVALRTGYDSTEVPPETPREDPRSAQQEFPTLYTAVRLTPETYEDLHVGGPVQLAYKRDCEPRSFRFKPAPDGTYSVLIITDVIGSPVGHFEARRGIVSQMLQMPMTVTSQGVSLGQTLEARADTKQNSYEGNWNIGSLPKGATEKASLGSDTVFSTSFGSVVPWGVLQSWQTPDNRNVRILLAQGDNDNQVKLCWASYLNYSRRLHCTIWTVPETWTRNEALEASGQYVIDDRSTMGEDGFIYLNSKTRQ